MTDPKGAHALAHTFISSSTDLLTPTDKQKAIKPGDTIVISTLAGGEVTAFGVVLDGVEQASTFPDYQERIDKGYLLVEWFSEEEEIAFTDVGWFPRCASFEVNEHAEEVSTWKVEGFPDSPPEWLMDAWRTMLSESHQVNPSSTPSPLRCPSCKSDEVYLNILEYRSAVEMAGNVTIDGEVKIVSFTDEPDWVQTGTYKLVCAGCGNKTIVPSEAVLNV